MIAGVILTLCFYSRICNFRRELNFKRLGTPSVSSELQSSYGPFMNYVLPMFGTALWSRGWEMFSWLIWRLLLSHYPVLSWPDSVGVHTLAFRLSLYDTQAGPLPGPDWNRQSFYLPAHIKANIHHNVVILVENNVSKIFAQFVHPTWAVQPYI